MDSFNRKEDFTKPHLSHARHLPALESLQLQIEDTLHGINLNEAGGFTMPTRVCCYSIAEIIEDLNRAILQSLKVGSYSAAETLSRTSLENSINLIFINNDKTSNTAKSLFLNYFKTAKDRARKWHRYAVSNDNAESIERSAGFEQSLDLIRGLFADLDSGGVKGWPDAYSRFRDAGYEFGYHTLFAPASDSTHSFSNDIFNRFFVEAFPVSDEEKKDQLDGHFAEKVSFAFYLATHAIQFYCVAASHISDRAADESAGDKLNVIGKTIAEMLMEHESLTKNCLDMLASTKKDAMEMRSRAKDT
ncbi:DUF5677 domain-containing protein [Pseudomonas rustica]|uniref:DUF5677 domain-containing protein n=1 Tax=Pseudomonas rustica TaxID=2827099 RepID=UPI003CF9E3C0